jgi:amino-acid N-acetyltransferase
LTDTLAEVRSLAVHESQQGKGLGGHIVLQLVQMARQRGFHQVCALTLRENFFVRLGFELVDRWSISPKIWQACIYCRKFHRCDEVAVLMNLVDNPRASEHPRARTAGWNTLLKWNEWQPLKLAYRQKVENVE